MNKIEFTLISLSHESDMVIESTKSIDDVLNNFLFLFTKEEDIDKENRKINIQSLQKNTPELRKRVDEFIEHYKNVNKKVFQLRTYFQKLYEGEHFLIFPGLILTQDQRFEFYDYLSSLQDENDFATIKDQTNELFGEIKKEYTFQAFDGSIKRYIGEREKAKRVCRFCNNTRTDVTFKNEAHAISEALGNKKIILNEECDLCNAEFGSASGIENSLITFLKFYGTFYGIGGKNGISKISGKNFSFSNDGEIKLEYYASNDDEIVKFDKDFPNVNFRLDTFSSIVMQDVYKTLCKFSISVLDSEFIPMFKDTIAWINGKTILSKLPMVAVLTSNDFFKTHPSIMVYLRKDGNTDLPFAVGEFHYTCLTFVFIIPLVKSDSKDFTDKKDYDIFWNFFKPYSMTKNWDYKNFSDNTKQLFSFDLNLNKLKKNN
ncbi:MAG: hypothetical protein WC755_06290 [Candidatus Woesearchaeota archaeon]|jgi:hypothetical protein